MKIFITSEILSAAINAHKERGLIFDALQAVTPLIANTVIEQVAREIQTQRDDVPAHGWEFAAAIRALKEPTP